ncbi:hypothetical protein BAUCODRAFT_552073 [Baudoinia panamericana UAMH 10762]|uniref:NmrA-like domain-containing protein n=1 Tax=Baudoinia panamericana (strain UAMH 10762) TaxID=717646 RepID=M2MDF7_BAUPA|nr:uncharacterized protein BAUCODRAFT_552073 [Baudoinia panamericana UAMH 10762]EMC94551.1 hypothetical protein BAUCODRAFT_552073 [Baudoinia panamericana UAMH 10762]
MAMKKVMLLGADGTLGPSMLNALLAHDFDVTVLKREGSRSLDNYPPNVKVARVHDDMPIHSLTTALKGQDALIATIKGSQTEVQKRLADACVASGVHRFIPADFGSCDSSSPLTQELVPLYKHKAELREYLTQLATSHESFSWTSLVCGHFFDWDPAFIHLWPQEHRADILDDGEKKFSISTLSRVGEATARILQHADETANQMLYVQSFCVTQNEIISAFEKATNSKWHISSLEAEKYKVEQKAKADAGDKDAVEHLVWYLGTVDADWTRNEGFAMQMLGLQDEDLHEVVSKMVKQSS